MSARPSSRQIPILHRRFLTAPEAPVLLTSGRSSSVGNAKLDQLYQKMAPLLDVSEKMDQVWNVLIGAKSSVDSLVPTSEALLWQTQRQERALMYLLYAGMGALEKKVDILQRNCVTIH